MGTDPGFVAPRVAVLCPCRGMEVGLERNLVTLTEFDHQNYEIFFILASANDPTAGILRRVIANSRPKAHLVIAGEPESCSEKVNNLRVAVEQLSEEFEVLVFADSDGRPGKSWLHRLVAPLGDHRVGAVTTMRWLVPNRSNLASALIAAWNAPVVTMLTEKGANFCWGGGTAIRRSDFEATGILDDWRTSVSDDYSVTRALESAGKSILFAPECLTLSFVETSFKDLLEFTNRQVLITRVYAHKIWARAAATHLLYCATITLGASLALSNLLAQRPSFHLAALLCLIFLLSAIRGAIRLTAVTEIFPASKSQLMGIAWIYILLPIVTPFLYSLNFLNSVLTRKIKWRGRCYELISPNQTRIVD